MKSIAQQRSQINQPDKKLSRPSLRPTVPPPPGAYAAIDQLLGVEGPPATEPQFNPQTKPKKGRAKRSAYEDGPTPAQLAKQQEDFMAGAEVVHEKFGKGEILGRLGSIALIAFEDIEETKRIELTTCLRNGLIRLAGL